MSEYFEFHTSRRLDGANLDKQKAIGATTKHFCNQEPREQMRQLQLFKDMIGASLNYALHDKSCCTDDGFLYRFLYARKFQLDAAYQLLINYLSYVKCHRTSTQLLSSKLNIFDEHVQLALRDGLPHVRRERDRRGRKILLFTAGNFEPSKYGLDDVYRAFLLSLDKLLENVENQVLGFIVIVDWTNFTFKKSTHLSPKVLKIMIEGLQDCMPVKFKGIHFIAQPWYVDLAFSVIKPFLNEKTKKRIIVHGTNLSTLHSLVSKDVLPTDLGGEGPNINTLDWFHYLVESSQTMEVNKPYRLIQTEVYAKAPLPNDFEYENNNQQDNQQQQQQQLLLNTS